ncbi:hypothetical protein KAW44_05980 [Candidatus Bipolaricaulota bacterium]|nr:hypothetical protein [Candidatus Bipolaricaulota bacterium]
MKAWKRALIFVFVFFPLALGVALARLYFSEVSVREPSGEPGLELRLLVLGGTCLLLLLLRLSYRLGGRRNP